jgi:hypothetical protein
MTREEAEAMARRLNEEAPDRDVFKRIARQRGEVWEVVKIRVPDALKRPPPQETVGG